MRMESCCAESEALHVAHRACPGPVTPAARVPGRIVFIGRALDYPIPSSLGPCMKPVIGASIRRASCVMTACAIAAGLGACSWGITLDPGGQKVRTAWNDDVGTCRDKGTITVSVLDHVGPMDRNSLKVRDELEVMARNEAAGLDADTIKPAGDPRDGEQVWHAYFCGTAAGSKRAPTRIEQRAPDGAVETFPIKHP